MPSTTGNVLDNDTDPDTSDVLSVSAFDAVGTGGGTVASNGDGTFNYDPNGQFDYLGSGDSADDTFTYTISDGNGGSDSGAFILMFSAWEDSGTDTAHIGWPDFGDLNRMVPEMSLVPVGPGGPVDGVCQFLNPLPAYPGTGYDEETLFECAFNAVPVNTYEVVASVGGGYYIGSDDGVLVVFDPSLGFTTGGGWFYGPGTADPDFEACGEEGYPGDKTTFGFNMKYNKKRTNIQGSLLLMRHTVDSNCEDADKYRVKSNALDGLSIGDGSDGC